MLGGGSSEFMLGVSSQSNKSSSENTLSLRTLRDSEVVALRVSRADRRRSASITAMEQEKATKQANKKKTKEKRASVLGEAAHVGQFTIEKFMVVPDVTQRRHLGAKLTEENTDDGIFWDRPETTKSKDKETSPQGSFLSRKGLKQRINKHLKGTGKKRQST